MKQSEAYLDIVWKQFKKNRAAYWSLWTLAPLFLVAIGAPAIASNQPFVFHDGDQTIYPWFRALFHPSQPVDFLFNMALLALVPWTFLSLVMNFWWKRREIPGRRRVIFLSSFYLILIAVLCVLFSLPHPDDTGKYLFRPNNKDWTRSFVVEEFDSAGTKHGVYPPLPFGPNEGDLPSRFRGPLYRKAPAKCKDVNDGFIHWLGTDNTGRDVMTRMIYGARISMSVGFVAVGIYVTIGVIVGAIAGYFGGRTDMLISRVIEIVLLFPSFFLILTLVALFGPSIYMIMVVIGITGWPTIARLIRGEVLKQRSIDYTTAAQALGASHLRIVFRHILPNALSPAMVAAPFGIAGAIVTEAGLSLLGFGVQPPTPSWGVLLQLGNGNYSHWWLIVVPSLAIFVAVTVFNLVGSGLRDAMDPRLRR